MAGRVMVWMVERFYDGNLELGGTQDPAWKILRIFEPKDVGEACEFLKDMLTEAVPEDYWRYRLRHDGVVG